MRRTKVIITLLAITLLATTAFAQDRTTGGIKGKVRAKGQGPVVGASVTVRQHDRDVASAVTDSKGEFVVQGLAPGIYGVTLRKTGLSVGTLEDIQVKAGKTTSLPDRLVLTENESSIARLWGSVFNEGGFSVSGVRLELARVEADGTARKIDGRLTNESGQAVFRLSPSKATYRLTVRAEGKEPLSKDVEIDGALVYRVAFTIPGQPK